MLLGCEHALLLLSSIPDHIYWHFRFNLDLPIRALESHFCTIFCLSGLIDGCLSEPELVGCRSVLVLAGELSCRIPTEVSQSPPGLTQANP